MIDNLAQQYIEFLNSSPSPYHAVNTVATTLQQHGFKQLSEQDTWQLTPGKYYVIRGLSSIIAFIVGNSIENNTAKFIITGTHTDSPVLKLRADFQTSDTNPQTALVQCYGGGLWHTWFDRDLSIAGLVTIKNSDNNLSSKLVNLTEPLLHIPSLAIHLSRGVNTDGFTFNLENHLRPIYTADVSDLKTAIINQLNLEKDSDVVEYDLSLYDNNPAILGGFDRRLVFSGRQDNLSSVFACLQGLVQSQEQCLRTGSISVFAAFDSEEVGSVTFNGASSPFLQNVLQGVSASLSLNHHNFQDSFLVSCDAGHAVHPNYPEKHLLRTSPILGKGVILKRHCNQHYATSVHTATTLKSKSTIQLQECPIRNDQGCGSTIGTILATKLGLGTIDIGCPILSMHSIRETGHISDIQALVSLVKDLYLSPQP